MKINPTGLDSLSSSRSAVWLSWICTKGRVLIIIVYKIWNLLTCRKCSVNQRWRCGQSRVDFRDPGVNQTLGDNDWSIVCDLIISQKINLRSWFWCIQSLNPFISMITNHNWYKKKAGYTIVSLWFVKRLVVFIFHYAENDHGVERWRNKVPLYDTDETCIWWHGHPICSRPTPPIG